MEIKVEQITKSVMEEQRYVFLNEEQIAKILKEHISSCVGLDVASVQFALLTKHKTDEWGLNGHLTAELDGAKIIFK